MIRRVAAHFVLGLRAPWRSRLVAALLVLLAATVLVALFGFLALSGLHQAAYLAAHLIAERP